MDPYVYPGTDVLKNLRDIRDDKRLRVFEADASARRLVELQALPPSGAFDARHLREIHRHIFQDVYHWAGEVRTVNISRAGQFPYAFPNRIEAALNSTFTALRNEKSLASLNPAQFAAKAAHYPGEINAVHPFREGNGRTQREFIRQLAQRSGHGVQWDRVSRDMMYEASHRSFQRGDNSGLEAVMRAAVRPQQQRALEARDAINRRGARDPDRGRDR